MPGSPTVVNTFTADLQLIPVPKQLWGMPFCLHDETLGFKAVNCLKPVLPKSGLLFLG